MADGDDATRANGWTTEPPADPGLWWWLPPGAAEPIVVELFGAPAALGLFDGFCRSKMRLPDRAADVAGHWCRLTWPPLPGAAAA